MAQETKREIARRVVTTVLSGLMGLLALFATATRADAASAATLQQMYGTLAESTGGYEAVQARVSGNTLTIDLYVNFRGAYNTRIRSQTYAALAKKGFRLWAGAYAGSQWDCQPGM
ncbi:MAG: hypothetical protein LBB75_09620, partial [Oscillospiraceae bacterium]|nr:hypothetical protein [Oscillospiraceae bacterium]